MFELFLTFLAWYVCGIAGFLYWWTEDYAIDGVALFDSLAFGLMGPLNLLLGFMVHRLSAGDAAEVEAEADMDVGTARRR